MRSGVAFAVCIGAALLSACDTLDGRYIREGIGTDLYSSEGLNTARFQDAYLGYVCQQAGLAFEQDGNALICREPPFSRGWAVVVQAGMNDIDRRCDAYLTWLDNRRRWVGPIHQQILDTEAATIAILAATATDPTRALAVVAAAFGFASHSFTNFNNRFLFEVEKSTVQSVVLTRQQKYRETLPPIIDNRPAAIYALRQYLRLCMPMTIETQINTTVKLFERGGVPALEDSSARPMIDARTVRTAVIRSATAPIREPQRAPVVIDDVRVGPYERQLGVNEIKDYQRLVCLPVNGKFAAATRQAILTWLRAKGVKDANFPDRISAKDGTTLRAALDDQGPQC